MTMEIREHSLQCVEDYIKSGGHHQEVSQWYEFSKTSQRNSLQEVSEQQPLQWIKEY
jgi:hypothetical protein